MECSETEGMHHGCLSVFLFRFVELSRVGGVYRIIRN